MSRKGSRIVHPESGEKKQRESSESISEDDDFSEYEFSLASPRKKVVMDDTSVEEQQQELLRSRAVTFRDRKNINQSMPFVKQPMQEETVIIREKPAFRLSVHKADVASVSLPSKEVTDWNPTADEVTLKSFGDYQMGEIIGKGGYGKVYKSFNRRNGQFVAIKEIQLSNEAAVEELSNILGEIQLLKKLKHQNIVRYIDYHYEHEKALHIVLEYIENGSLKDTIKKFGKLPEALTARYSFQVLQGLSYLHFKDILHGDIKGANILITKDGICKLADFGVARQLTPTNQVSSTALGTTYWTAPEILEASEASKASDVWSFGCTVIELLTGKPPYRDLKPLEAVRMIIENEYPPFPPDITDELTDFLHCCFRKDPKARKSISELMYHPWIKKFGRRKSGHRFNVRDSTEDLHTLLDSVKASPDVYGMDYIKDEEFVEIVRRDADTLLEKFEERSFVWMSPTEMAQDQLRQSFCDIQAENRLLLLLVQQLNEKIQVRGGSVPPSLGVNAAIERVETNLSRLSSDTRLAQSVYNTASISYDKFPDAKRGILLMKRASKKTNGSSKTSRWKKRWILLQNDFLFCYRPDNMEENPVITILLRNPKIVPIAERDIGKKNCFQLTCGSISYYFAAAKPDVLMKWICAFDEIVPWYYSGNPELESLFNEEAKSKDEISPAPPRTSARRTRTVPSITRIRSRKKLNAMAHETEESPFPGIRLKTEEDSIRDDSPFPGIRLKTEDKSTRDDSPFPGVRLKTQDDGNTTKKSRPTSRRTITLPSPRRKSLIH